MYLRAYVTSPDARSEQKLQAHLYPSGITRAVNGVACVDRRRRHTETAGHERVAVREAGWPVVTAVRYVEELGAELRGYSLMESPILGYR